MEQRDARFSKMAREKGSDENGISFGYHPGHAPAEDEGGEVERRRRRRRREGEKEEEEEEDDRDEDEEERGRGDGEAAKRTEAVDRRNRVKEVGLVSCWAH